MRKTLNQILIVFITHAIFFISNDNMKKKHFKETLKYIPIIHFTSETKTLKVQYGLL